jgi:outer membrane usher protein
MRRAVRNPGIEPRLRTYHILATALSALAPCTLLLAAAAGAAAPQAASASKPLHEEVLEINVNEQDSGEMLVVLRDSDEGFWLEEGDFARLRLRTPAGELREVDGRRYRPLTSIPGARVRLDVARQQLVVQVPVAAFIPARLSAPGRFVGTPGRADTGLFANYQVSGQRIGASNLAAGYAELGLFGRFGVLTSTHVARTVDGQSRQLRLDTTFSHDFPERLQTVNLGDAVSDPGSWGNALRFAGIRFSRNFGIRPDLVTTPLLTATGNAVVPSSVDVFVNNQRVLTQQVLPGPFTVDNLPAVTGTGDVRVLIRDALGREQTLTQSFYSGPSLLASGLNQYSFNLGRMRENYAFTSFDYGPWIGSASLRRGLNDSVTLEGHAEFEARAARALGLNLAARLGALGIGSMTVARGGDAQVSGWLGGLAFERRGQLGSVAASTTYAADGFRQVGDLAISGARPKLRAVAQAGLNLGRTGTLSLAYARRTFRDLPAETALSLSHSARLGDAGYVSLTVSRSTGSLQSTSVYLTFTTALGPRRTLEMTADGGSGVNVGSNELRATLMQSAPIGTGAGWRLGATTAGNYDADWQQQFETADVELETARNFNQTGQSVQLRGSATLLGGELRATRSINGSFALVEIADVPDLPVYVENQLVTHTDSRGRAMLHNLRSYDANRISIEPEDLPIDTSLATRTLVIQPAYRSGVIARFPVEHVSPGVFRLLLEDRKPVPTGASVAFNGGTFAVALEGLTYVTTFDHGVGGTATWDGGRCVFRLDPPPHGDPLPDMGVVLCRSTKAAGP